MAVARTVAGRAARLAAAAQRSPVWLIRTLHRVTQLATVWVLAGQAMAGILGSEVLRSGLHLLEQKAACPDRMEALVVKPQQVWGQLKPRAVTAGLVLLGVTVNRVEAAPVALVGRTVTGLTAPRQAEAMTAVAVAVVLTGATMAPELMREQAVPAVITGSTSVVALQVHQVMKAVVAEAETSQVLAAPGVMASSCGLRLFRPSLLLALVQAAAAAGQAQWAAKAASMAAVAVAGVATLPVA